MNLMKRWICCITCVCLYVCVGVHESTAQQMVSDPTLVHVLVRFLSGSNPHGTSQHSSQVYTHTRTHLRCLFYFSVLLQCESRSVCAGGSYCDSSHAGVSDPVTGPLVLHLSSDVQRVPAQASAHPLHRTVRSPALLTCLFFFVLFPYFLTALLISILNF